MNVSGLLWNRSGSLRLEGASLVAELPQRTVRVWATAASVFDPNVGAVTPYLAVPLAEEFGISTGIGCDKPDSDKFYHWGGLLGLIPLMDAGFVEGPEAPLSDGAAGD